MVQVGPARRQAEGPAVEVEGPLATTRSSLRDGSADVLIASYPFDGMANGPALLRERRVLAVAADHPLAGETSVSLEVLADHPVVQYPTVTSTEFKRDRTPDRTPAGRPVPKGLASNTTARVREFVRAAVDADDRSGD